MSTMTMTPSAVQRAEGPRLTFSRVVAAEWSKLFTLRGNYVTAAIMLVVSALMGMAYAYSAINSNDAAPPGQGFDAAGATALTVSSVSSFGSLIIGVLAVLIITNEYSTGTIQSTLTAVPRRTPVLGAKLVVTLVTTSVLTMVGIVIAYATGSALLAGRGLAASLFEPDVLANAAAVIVAMLATCVFALMLATLIRSSSAAISTVLALLFVLPVLSSFLPNIGDLRLGLLLFSNALSATTSTFTDGNDDPLLWVYITAAALWLVVPGILAFVLFKRRDA